MTKPWSKSHSNFQGKTQEEVSVLTSPQSCPNVSRAASSLIAKEDASLVELLNKGTAALEIDLDDHQKTKLLGFLDLLAKWGAVYNLTAIREPQQMLIHHLLDSLALVPHLASLGRSTLLDVGTGGGLPGVVLAIALPEWEITLNDRVHKKTAFLTQAKTMLSLPNVVVASTRVEALQSQLGVEKRFDVIVSRAFAKLTDFVNLTRHLVAPSGSLWAMKGVQPEAEIAELPDGVKVTHIHELKVPFLEAKRCLVRIKLASI